MALQTLAHGEPQWDAKVNSAIEVLNGLQGKEDSNEYHDWNRDGLVLHNGFFWDDDNANGYRYWKMANGWKLVELLITTKLSNEDNNFHGGKWFTLPDIVKAPSLQLKESTAGGLYTFQASPTTVEIHYSANEDAFNNSGWVYMLHTMYFTK